MAKTQVQTLDLNFRGRPEAIASYLLEHSSGAVLVESGPASTLETLKAALGGLGMTLKDVTHVLVTHIHLDHSGAAGWLAQAGAQVYVHPVGAPHLIDPEKLLTSAGRIYGDMMAELWGETIPVPAEKVTVVQDTEEIVIGDLRFVALDTPGHAEHHYAYLLDDVCFTGDIGGVRIPGPPFIRLPMPPPELHLEKWRRSLQRMRMLSFDRIAPTHFGIFTDVDWHLGAAEKFLDSIESWLVNRMVNAVTAETFRDELLAWYRQQAAASGLPESVINTFEVANPSGMSADGLMRYWQKHRE